MVTKKQVISVLKKCYDPELFVSVVDLGLIYSVDINKGNVNIKMGLTSPNCPMQSFILEDIKNKILKLKGVKEVNVDLVFEPWSPDKVSKKVKKKLGWL